MTFHKWIPVIELARQFPGTRGATSSHPSMWVRYILKGCLGVDRVRHRLPATRVGTRWMVTMSDVEGFFAALAAPAESAEAPRPIPVHRAAAAAAAARELEDLGA